MKKLNQQTIPQYKITPETIEKHWPLTHVKLGSILQKSGERVTGEIISDQGKYVYKIADPIKTAEAMKKDTAVFDVLNEKSFPYIPKLLKTKNLQDFQPLEHKFVYVLEFIEGKNPEQTPETFSKLAEIMVSLHDIKGYPYKTDFKASGVIRDLYKNSESYSFGAEYRKILDQLPNFDQFPQALIHTDIAPNNAIQKPGGSIILVDWDDAGIGTRVLDLGVLVINVFVNENLEYNQANAKAFFNSYLSRKKLTELEINHIFDAGLFFSCMYIIYGKGLEKNWARIKWAMKHRKMLESEYGIR